MAANSAAECTNLHSIVVLPNGEAKHPSHAKYLEAPSLVKSEKCSNTEPNSQNHSNEKANNTDSYAPCSLDIDMEKGKEDFVANEASTANWMSDDYSTREAHLQFGGKFVQFLMNLVSNWPKFMSRDKFMAERAQDAPAHRTRKYKRYPSFNSRRLVLMFSVLSSVGTIVLIYLTLRVRQIDDGAGNV